jgi:hypothetical protein
LPLGSRGAHQHAIVWSTFAGRDAHWASSFARRQSGDAFQTFWGGPRRSPRVRVG